MTNANLSDTYRAYIACLNRNWPKLGQFVDDRVTHNGRQIGLSGYRQMLEADFVEIPDLHFNIQLLIADAPYVASRLAFDCSAKGRFLGLDVNGKRVSFYREHLLRIPEQKSVQVRTASTRRRSKPSFERTWCNAGSSGWRRDQFPSSMLRIAPE